MGVQPHTFQIPYFDIYIYSRLQPQLLFKQQRYQYHNKMASSSEPPPPYDASTRPNPASNINNLQVPNARNGIPPHDRRSMEDEFRDLPQGWTRQYDEQSHHQFFVDTRANPPRSIWHHPYDDEQYLSSLTPDERSRIQSLHRVPTPADIQAESSGDDERGSSSHPPLPARDNSEKLSGAHKLGRKMNRRRTSDICISDDRCRRRWRLGSRSYWARTGMGRMCISSRRRCREDIRGMEEAGTDTIHIIRVRMGRMEILG